MKKNNDEYVKEWILFARDNLIAAKKSIKSDTDNDFIPYHTVCFMCQGSAEKYLKAFLIWNGWNLKKTHDLEDLLVYAIELDYELEKLRDECKILNEYITEGRYPGDLPWEMIEKKDAEEAIEAADKIANFVTEKIKLE